MVDFIEGRKVWITWTDSGTYHENGWESREDILNETPGLVDVETVGTLVWETEDAYYVALSADNVNKHYYGVQIIGKFAVRGYRMLDTGPSRSAMEVYFDEQGDQW